MFWHVLVVVIVFAFHVSVSVIPARMLDLRDELMRSLKLLMNITPGIRGATSCVCARRAADFCVCVCPEGAIDSPDAITMLVMCIDTNRPRVTKEVPSWHVKSHVFWFHSVVPVGRFLNFLALLRYTALPTLF